MELNEPFLLLSHFITGQQLTTFNHQSKVFVGGKMDSSGKLVRPFRGSLAGLIRLDRSLKKNLPRLFGQRYGAVRATQHVTVDRKCATSVLRSVCGIVPQFRHCNFCRILYIKIQEVCFRADYPTFWKQRKANSKNSNENNKKKLPLRTMLAMMKVISGRRMSLLVGLVFNGVAVLGLAAEGIDQVTIQGDVELHVQPLLSHRSVTCILYVFLRP